MGEGNNDHPIFVIQMFGINEKGQTCCIYVNNYQPFFYVKVAKTFDQNDCQELMMQIKEDMKFEYLKSCVLKAELVEKNKLYGFSGGNKDNFVKFTFQNQLTMNKVKGLWYNYYKDKDGNNQRTMCSYKFKSNTLDIYEGTIPPLLRFFHIHNISPSGWIFVNTDKALVPETFHSTCQFEYICKINEIKPLPKKETIVPYKICSFDIEASSSHGDFPLPIKTYKRVASNMVDIFMRMKQTNTLNEKMANKLVKRCILTAFKMDKLENMDVVYTKQKPNKTFVENQIEELLKTPLSEIKLSHKNQDIDSLLTLEETFAQVASETNYEGVGEGGEGGENGQDIPL